MFLSGVFVLLTLCLHSFECKPSNEGSGSKAESTSVKLTDSDIIHLSGKYKQFAKDGEQKHDVYAYKLPTDTWVILRYKQTDNGKPDEYMKVVGNILDYLKDVEDGVRSISLNVAGVETVLRFDGDRNTH